MQYIRLKYNSLICRGLKAAGILVLGKIGLDTEAFSALPAPVLLDLVVGLAVGPEVGSVGKLFAALAAAEWFLPRV